jgi:hypothetical protein
MGGNFITTMYFLAGTENDVHWPVDNSIPKKKKRQMKLIIYIKNFDLEFCMTIILV